MRTTKRETVALLRDLFRTIELRKELERDERMLKDRAKLIMRDQTLLVAGKYAIMKQDVSRHILDKEALSEVINLDLYKKETVYTKLTVSENK